MISVLYESWGVHSEDWRFNGGSKWKMRQERMKDWLNLGGYGVRKPDHNIFYEKNVTRK